MKQHAKKHLLIIISILLIIGVGNWLHTRSYTVILDDARIASHIISISSKKAGWIDEIPVSEGELIKSKAILVKIDTQKDELALEAFDVKIAQKQLMLERAQAKRNIIVQQTSSNLAAEEAHLQHLLVASDKAKSILDIAQSTYERNASMWDKKLSSAENWDDAKLSISNATHTYSEAQANVAEQESKLLSAQADLQELQIQDKTLAILQQESKLLVVQREQQQLILEESYIKSPLENAVIDKNFANIGEYAIPGYGLMMLHNPQDIWISANAKETDITRIHIGSKAKVKIDAYPIVSLVPKLH